MKTIIVTGTPGTGKSILCAQILYHNALQGKKCLYLNLEQNEGRLESQMQQFGWKPEKLKNLKIIGVDSSDPNLVEYILKEIQKTRYDLIVLDSLDSISSNPLTLEEVNQKSLQQIAEFTIPTMLDSPTIGRLKLKKIFSAIAKSKATALLTSEKVEGTEGFSRDTISEFLCDGIVLLNYVEIGITDYRSLIVRKLRNSNHTKDVVPFNITNKGIEIIKKQKND